MEIYIEQLHLLHLPLLVMDLHSLLSIEYNIGVSSSFPISVPSRPGIGPTSSLVFRWLKELSMVSCTILYKCAKGSCWDMSKRPTNKLFTNTPSKQTLEKIQIEMAFLQ